MVSLLAPEELDLNAMVLRDIALWLDVREGNEGIVEMFLKRSCVNPYTVDKDNRATLSHFSSLNFFISL